MDTIAKTEESLFHVYNRFPYVFNRGEGMYIYDENDRPYLDFGSGIGVMAFGYCDPEFTSAIEAQIHKLLHTSNLFYHTGLTDAAKRLCDFSKMEKVFFTNSGAEAIEGALKCAKKYASNKGKGQEIIAMNSSFHGRTVGALSVTGTESYRHPFYPLMDGVVFADYNNIDSVKAAVNENTCAIILEPLQGEGGIIPGKEDFLRDVRALCDERDIVLIFDEVQCGLCRTGTPYVWQRYNIKPDILVTAKALGAGIPVGAFLVNEKLSSNSLVPGDHGTTYGGNPLACAAVSASLSIMEKRDICAHVNELSPYFENILDEFVSKSEKIESRRGLGFMQGLVLNTPVIDTVKSALEHGLILLSAGGNVLRMLPPLVTQKEDFDKFRDILRDIL